MHSDNAVVELFKLLTLNQCPVFQEDFLVKFPGLT